MKNSYSCLACMMVAFVVGMFIGMLCMEQQEDTDMRPPLGDCETELEMERHWHREYYRQFEECQLEISRYTKQSIDAVCLREYDDWQALLDECWDDKRTHYTNLDVCEAELSECLLKQEGVWEEDR